MRRVRWSGWLALAVMATVLGPRPAEAQRKLAVEASGGVVGALAGFGLGWAVLGERECGDDLECVFRNVAAVSATSALGGAAGTWLAGKWGGTEPGLVGAGVGAVVGVAAGLGLAKVFEEAAERDAAVVVAFSIPVGVLAAVGSRVEAGRRGRR